MVRIIIHSFVLLVTSIFAGTVDDIPMSGSVLARHLLDLLFADHMKDERDRVVTGGNYTELQKKLRLFKDLCIGEKLDFVSKQRGTWLEILEVFVECF